MALPRLNEFPTYTLKLPSTDQQVKFRPFVTKEQKVLMIALETGDRQNVAQAIEDIITTCTDIKDYSQLTTFDVEYIFLQLRSKSVGEKADIKVRCDECGEFQDVQVDLSKIKVSGNTKPVKIKLTDSVTVEMRYPAEKEITANQALLEAGSYTQELIELIVTSMYKIYTDEEMFLVSDSPKEEVYDFVESTTKPQFQKMVEFVTSIPQTKHDINFTCTSCGHESTLEITGISDFFG